MTTGIKCRRAPPAWFSRVFSRLPPLFALLYLTDTLAALRKKNRPTGHLKSTGFEKYGVALGILALRIFRRGRTWPYVSKGKVVVCKLKQSAPSRLEKYGVASPKLPFQIFHLPRTFQVRGKVASPAREENAL